MSDSVDRVFVHALNTVKKIPRTGSARPPPTDRLRLYGLYKQSMEGNVEGVMARPEGQDEDVRAEQDKWDAWSAQHTLTRTEAKRRYISTLIDTMHKYASTTTEAQELVGELEFVWDQIKSNPVSSSSSTPPGGQMRQGLLGQEQGYSSLGPEIGAGGRLRALRPVSDGDVDGDEEDDFDKGRNERYGENQDRGEEGDFIARNQKWKKRIEQNLMRLTTEVAALREQMEARRVFARGTRKGLTAWMLWLVWITLRHMIVDAAILGLMWLWARQRGDTRTEQVLRVLWEVALDRARRLRIPWLQHQKPR